MNSQVISDSADAPERPGQMAAHVDWRAVLAGALAAAAIMALLVAFGSAIGLSMTSARPYAGASATLIAILATIWLVLVHIGSFAVGGYLSARLRERFGASQPEREFRDGAHGFLAWALVTVLSAYLLASGAASAVKGTADVAASAVGGAAQGPASAASAGAGSNPLSYWADSLLRRPAQGPGAAARDDASSAEIARIIAMDATGARMNPADRQYLIALVAARSGLSPADAERRVDEIMTRYRAFVTEAEATVRAAAEKARRGTVVAAFVVSAVALAGLVAAVWAAGIGGTHREQNKNPRFLGQARLW